MAEMLISLAKFVSNFQIVDSPVTELKGNLGDPFFFSYPEVKVKLEPRS